MGQVIGGIKKVETRKDHHCCWCDEIIEKGSEVETWTWKDMGDIRTLYIHPECNEARKREDNRTWMEFRERGMTMEESHEYGSNQYKNQPEGSGDNERD